MPTKSITERIRDCYCNNDKGEWLAKKSHIKEAKLLKDACLHIEKLEEFIRNNQPSSSQQFSLFQE